MGDIKELTRLLAELDDQLVNCMRCGLCQAVCPVFAQSQNEGDVTRGKIALLDGLAKRMIDNAEGVKKRLDKCLMCGTCAANCPSGVDAMDIFIKSRAILTGYVGLSPVKRAIFRGALSHPKLFTRLLKTAGKFQGLGISEASGFMGTSCSKIMSPLLGDRHFMPLSKAPLHEKEKARDEKRGASGLKVAFYPGCVTDKIYPSIGTATLKVLAHHGVSVFMPENQGCCGIPALSSGDTKTFETLLTHNLELFARRDFDYLVTPCATCTSTIKKLWPKMAGDMSVSVKGAAVALAEKTMDISQFLVDVVGVKAIEEGADRGEKVAYHDPCHLQKSLGVSEQPRAIIGANPGASFVEMNEAGYCCGNGGSFNLQHYDTSYKIGERKRGNILASGASVAATSCPACMMQMTDVLSRNGDPVKVKHVIEVYAECL